MGDKCVQFYFHIKQRFHVQVLRELSMVCVARCVVQCDLMFPRLHEIRQVFQFQIKTVLLVDITMGITGKWMWTGMMPILHISKMPTLRNQMMPILQNRMMPILHNRIMPIFIDRLMAILPNRMMSILHIGMKCNVHRGRIW